MATHTVGTDPFFKKVFKLDDTIELLSEEGKPPRLTRGSLFSNEELKDAEIDPAVIAKMYAQSKPVTVKDITDGKVNNGISQTIKTDAARKKLSKHEFDNLIHYATTILFGILRPIGTAKWPGTAGHRVLAEKDKHKFGLQWLFIKAIFAEESGLDPTQIGIGPSGADAGHYGIGQIGFKEMIDGLSFLYSHRKRLVDNANLSKDDYFPPFTAAGLARKLKHPLTTSYLSKGSPKEWEFTKRQRAALLAKVPTTPSQNAYAKAFLINRITKYDQVFITIANFRRRWQSFVDNDYMVHETKGFASETALKTPYELIAINATLVLIAYIKGWGAMRIFMEAIKPKSINSYIDLLRIISFLDTHLFEPTNSAATKATPSYAIRTMKSGSKLSGITPRTFQFGRPDKDLLPGKTDPTITSNLITLYGDNATMEFVAEGSNYLSRKYRDKNNPERTYELKSLREPVIAVNRILSIFGMYRAESYSTESTVIPGYAFTDDVINLQQKFFRSMSTTKLPIEKFQSKWDSATKSGLKWPKWWTGTFKEIFGEYMKAPNEVATKPTLCL